MSRKVKDEHYRFFSVSEPRTHDKGHTEYKVTARVSLILRWQQHTGARQLCHHGEPLCCCCFSPRFSFARRHYASPAMTRSQHNSTAGDLSVQSFAGGCGQKQPKSAARLARAQSELFFNKRDWRALERNRLNLWSAPRDHTKTPRSARAQPRDVLDPQNCVSSLPRDLFYNRILAVF